VRLGLLADTGCAHRFLWFCSLSSLVRRRGSILYDNTKLTVARSRGHGCGGAVPPPPRRHVPVRSCGNPGRREAGTEAIESLRELFAGYRLQIIGLDGAPRLEMVSSNRSGCRRPPASLPPGELAAANYTSSAD
jgi:hypothetical protein